MRKLSYEYVKNFFESHGCKLLESFYINVKTKIRYICKCGNESVTTFGHFQQGKRCSYCAGNKKLSYDEVAEYFKNNGCELLGKEYKNANSRMKYKCLCGNI